MAAKISILLQPVTDSENRQHQRIKDESKGENASGKPSSVSGSSAKRRHRLARRAAASSPA